MELINKQHTVDMTERMGLEQHSTQNQKECTMGGDYVYLHLNFY